VQKGQILETKINFTSKRT